jgi:hypothetical protein
VVRAEKLAAFGAFFRLIYQAKTDIAGEVLRALVIRCLSFIDVLEDLTFARSQIIQQTI